MGWEDAEARVFQRDEVHQYESVGAVAADLVGVDASRFVAVVAVGDQQLGRVKRLAKRGLGVKVVDSPEAVDGSVVVGLLSVRLALCLGGDRRAGGAGRIGVERKDRRQVGLGCTRQTETVLLWARVRALMGANLAGPVFLDLDCGKETRARAATTVGREVVLSQDPERWFVVSHQRASLLPLGQ